MSDLYKQLQVNPYGGCYLSAAQLSGATTEQLAQLLSALTTSPYKLCWLELAAADSALAAYLAAHGFEFHHCQASQLMLVKKLKADAYLPLAATHTIGVGAAVLNSNGDILLVREQPLPGQTPGYWKLPGGMVEPHEHIADAAVREVREETGIDAQFVRLISLRHHHHGQFGASNFYMVAVMKALSTDISPDPVEIAQARWWAPAEFFEDEKASPYNKLLVEAALSSQGWDSVKVAGYRQSPELYEMFVDPVVFKRRSGAR